MQAKRQWCSLFSFQSDSPSLDGKSQFRPQSNSYRCLTALLHLVNESRATRAFSQSCCLCVALCLFCCFSKLRSRVWIDSLCSLHTLAELVRVCLGSTHIRCTGRSFVPVNRSGTQAPPVPKKIPVYPKTLASVDCAAPV